MKAEALGLRHKETIIKSRIRITDTGAMILLTTQKTIFLAPYISWSPICTNDDETDCIILNSSSDIHSIRYGNSRIRRSGREP